MFIPCESKHYLQERWFTFTSGRICFLSLTLTYAGLYNVIGHCRRNTMVHEDGAWCTSLLWMLILVKMETVHVRIWNQELGHLGPTVIFHEDECVCSYVRTGMTGVWLHAEWLEQRQGKVCGEKVDRAIWPPRWRGEEMYSHIPSCASAAVLVVGAAGLVCCRPTIGQRGVQFNNATEHKQPLRECVLIN